MQPRKVPSEPPLNLSPVVVYGRECYDGTGSRVMPVGVMVIDVHHDIVGNGVESISRCSSYCRPVLWMGLRFHEAHARRTAYKLRRNMLDVVEDAGIAHSCKLANGIVEKKDVQSNESVLCLIEENR